MDERKRPAERFSAERSHLRAVVYGIFGFSATWGTVRLEVWEQITQPSPRHRRSVSDSSALKAAHSAAGVPP